MKSIRVHYNATSNRLSLYDAINGIETYFDGVNYINYENGVLSFISSELGEEIQKVNGVTSLKIQKAVVKND